MKVLLVVAATVLIVAPSFAQTKASDPSHVATPSSAKAQKAETAPTEASLAEMTLEEMEAFVQKDIQAKLAALDAGDHSPFGEEKRDDIQVLDIGNDEHVILFDDFALLISEGNVFGLSMFADGVEDTPADPSGVAADCLFMPPDTVFCTYVWGNKVRVMIFRRNEDGSWSLIHDTGWQSKTMKPGTTPNSADHDAAPEARVLP